MISVQNLTLQYDQNVLFDNISKDFEAGKVHGIVGLNGAGKSSFFNLLSSQIKPKSGNILNSNEVLSHKSISFLETSNFFYPNITGAEYLKIFDQTNANFDLEAFQQFFKLPLNELINKYSTGMKKKLAILGFLKQDKEIYILDEPYNGLDLESNKVVNQIVHSLKDKQKTLFISSHILDPLLTICDTIHLLKNGKFIQSFEKEEFSKIEKELFGSLEDDVKKVIGKAL